MGGLEGYAPESVQGAEYRKGRVIPRCPTANRERSMRKTAKCCFLCVVGAFFTLTLFGCSWWEPIASFVLDFIVLPIMGKTP